MRTILVLMTLATNDRACYKRLLMSDLLTILKQDYDRKNERNPNYSRRSYARWLGLSHTSLTLFLNGKRGLSLDARKKILSRLTISPEKSAEILIQARAGATAFKQVDFDKLPVISDWFYFAVLSLMETKTFKEDPIWVAKRLNISVENARVSLERLETLGLAVRTKKGRLQASGASLTTPDQVANLVMRRSHYQAFELAKASLDRHAVEKRDFSAMTMAIDPDRIPEAKRKIKNFRRKLCQYLESGQKKEVYRLGIQLFPLSEDCDS